MSTSQNMTFPVGFRFCPTDLGLVRRYLRNKVDRNESEFIKTLNVYENDPWRLDHDPNPLFKENEWYYFVPRTSATRTVPGKGESEGGTWKSTSLKEIEDDNKVVFGWKRIFVYNKKVKGKPVKTDWHMTEYSFDKDQFQDLVLCSIRDNVKNKDIVELEEEEEERGDVNQQQQQQEKDALILLPPPPPPLQSNDTNNVMMISNQEPYGFDGAEDETVIDELMKCLDDAEDETIDELMKILEEGIVVTQQQQRE